MSLVRYACASGEIRESAKASIEYMAPEGSPDAVLERMRRMTDAIVDALYALPVEALDRERTKEHAVSICLSYWPLLQGKTGGQ